MNAELPFIRLKKYTINIKMNEQFNYQLEKLNDFIIGIFFGMNLTNKDLTNDPVNMIGMGIYALYKARVLYTAYMQG